MPPKNLLYKNVHSSLYSPYFVEPLFAFLIDSKEVCGCFPMSGVRMLHFLKDWWKFIQIHQYYTMAVIKTTLRLEAEGLNDFFLHECHNIFTKCVHQLFC